MATYYADLSLVGTGGDGSIGNPWWTVDFKAVLNGTLAAGSIVKVKGSYAYSGGSGWTIKGSGNTHITVENWDPAPWRIYTGNTLSLLYSTLKNAVIDTDNNNIQLFQDSELLNCQITNNAGIFRVFSTPLTVKGCSIKVGQFQSSVNWTDIGAFKDCIVDCNVFTNCDGYTWDNCAFTTGTVSGTLTNCQLNWVMPSLPAWNAAQSAFDSATLSVGLTTPPEPGNPPYTDYTLGLWDSARIGIGAMEFTTVPTPLAVGTRYIAKVTANGWVKDHIYEWDGVQWTDTPPVEGACVVIKELFDTYTFLNGVWTENNTPWLDPIIEIFNNTVALPVSPSDGDRYIAQVTANGWTINYVYEWNGNTWIGTQPVIGMFVFNEDTSDTLYYSGSAWVIFSPLTVHAIGGPLHSTSTVTDIKTKVSGTDFLITSQQSEFPGLSPKATPVSADTLIIEDSADLNKKKSITIGTLPSTAPSGAAGGDLEGFYPNPTVAQVSKSFNLTGIIYDTIAAKKDDYNPIGLADASTIQLTMSGDQIITGLAGGVAGRIIIIQSGYTGSTDKLTLANNSGDSAVGNRFYCPLSTDFTLSDDNSVILQYDGIQQHWIIIATCQAPYGNASNTICEGDDSRLSNSRTPTSHASTHRFGGSDPVHKVWQYGTGAPPATTGLPDGALYIKYIP